MRYEARLRRVQLLELDGDAKALAGLLRLSMAGQQAHDLDAAAVARPTHAEILCAIESRTSAQPWAPSNSRLATLLRQASPAFTTISARTLRRDIQAVRKSVGQSAPVGPLGG